MAICCQAGVEQPRQVQLTRTVSLPTQSVEPGTPLSLLRESPERLAVTTGGEDELPVGPMGFDILPDGSFVVGDPVLDRLVFFDSLGNYRGDQELEFSPLTVDLLTGGMLEVTDAGSDRVFVIDELGQSRLVPSSDRTDRIARETGQARLDRSTGQTAELTWSGPGRASSEPLQISLDREGSRMVSVRGLGTSDRDHTFVELETTRGGPAIQVEKIIRVYGSRGELVAEIPDLLQEYHVHPATEFRIRGESVYQLVPLSGEVRLNVWKVF